MKVTVLGCGSSAAVPQIGCGCAVCTSTNPKNRRTRVSILLESHGKNILIDTSPDLYQQALRERLTRIDAIVYTHGHADHTHGIDDIRAFNVAIDDGIPVYADAATMQMLQSRFAYIFKPRPERIWFRPCLYPHTIPTEPLSQFDVLGTNFTPILQLHGKETSLGFRIGNFAYSTDINGIPDESWEKLEGLDVWIVDCLRITPSMTHARLEMTLEWIEKLRPKLSILTHMAHDFDYEKLKAALPAHIVPAYDGLVVQL